MSQDLHWRCSFTCTCTFFWQKKKCVTEVEVFKLVSVEKLVLEIDLAALNNFCGDKIKILNE